MPISKVATLLLSTAGLVAGHGYVTNINVDGTNYGGYLVDTYYYESDPPELIAWSTTATDDGYVAPTAYNNTDIVCHRGAEPGALSAPVSPGGSVALTWNTWPDSHHGPVITYLANCNGDCASVDKANLEFFKIDEGGLVTDTPVPGTWASDQLIAANFTRTVTIPTDIAAGNYTLRHEIIALHGAEELDGAQNYPQCVNLRVTGSGTATPSGTPGTALYKDTDPGIYVDIWNALSNYTISGPALYTAGSAAAAAAANTVTSATAAATATMASSVSITSTAAEMTATTSATTTQSSLTSTAAESVPTIEPVTPASLSPQPSSSDRPHGHSGSSLSGSFHHHDHTPSAVEVTSTPTGAVWDISRPSVSSVPSASSTAFPKAPMGHFRGHHKASGTGWFVKDKSHPRDISV